MVMKTVEDKELLEMPIGVFDSGMGGLTVMREIMRQIPNERIIYFGDTARVPYGSKSRETVTRYSRPVSYTHLPVAGMPPNRAEAMFPAP